VQVEPIKPMLKAPGSKHLKLKYDNLITNLLQPLFSNSTCAVTSRTGAGGARWRKLCWNTGECGGCRTWSG